MSEPRLSGTVALVTGAARGLGRATAVRFASEGADLLLTDVAGALPGVDYDHALPSDLDETAALVEKHGRRAVTALVDVRDLGGLRAAVDDGVARLGRLDTVVANAGICIPRAWDAVTPEIFRDTMDVNVTGVWNTVMAGAPHLVDGGRGGSIVLISSAAGIKVQPFMVHYTASKFAVRGMAKAFAAELARHRIRVNSVHPTGMATPMGGGDMQAAVATAMADDQRLGAMFLNMQPVAVTDPDDVARTIAFLASDDARHMTAHELAPDAGVTEM